MARSSSRRSMEAIPMQDRERGTSSIQPHNGPSMSTKRSSPSTPDKQTAKRRNIKGLRAKDVEEGRMTLFTGSKSQVKAITILAGKELIREYVFSTDTWVRHGITIAAENATRSDVHEILLTWRSTHNLPILRTEEKEYSAKMIEYRLTEATSRTQPNEPTGAAKLLIRIPPLKSRARGTMDNAKDARAHREQDICDQPQEKPADKLEDTSSALAAGVSRLRISSSAGINSHVEISDKSDIPSRTGSHSSPSSPLTVLGDESSLLMEEMPALKSSQMADSTTSSPEINTSADLVDHPLRGSIPPFEDAPAIDRFITPDAPFVSSVSFTSSTVDNRGIDTERSSQEALDGCPAAAKDDGQEKSISSYAFETVASGSSAAGRETPQASEEECFELSTDHSTYNKDTAQAYKLAEEQSEAEVEQEKVRWNKENDELTRQNSVLVHEIEQYRLSASRDIQMLKDDLTRSREHIDELESYACEARVLVKHLQDEVDSLTSQNQKLVAEKEDEITFHLQQRSTDPQGLSHDLAQALSSIESYQQKCAELELEKHELQNTLAQAKQDYDYRASELEREAKNWASKELDDAETRFRSQQDALSSKAQLEISKLSEKEEILMKQMTESAQRHAQEAKEMEESAALAHRELQRLEGELQVACSQRDAEIARRDEDLVKAEVEARQSRTREEKLKQQLSKSDEARTEERQKNTAELEDLRRKYAAEVSRLVDELASVRRLHDEERIKAESEAKGAKEREEGLQRELQVACSQRDAEIARRDEDLVEAEVKARQSRTREEKLKQQLSKSDEARTDERQKNMAELEDLRGKYAAEVSRLVDELASVRRLHDEERIKAESETKEAREREEGLKKQLDESQRKCSQETQSAALAHREWKRLEGELQVACSQRDAEIARRDEDLVKAEVKARQSRTREEKLKQQLSKSDEARTDERQKNMAELEDLRGKYAAEVSRLVDELASVRRLHDEERIKAESEAKESQEREEGLKKQLYDLQQRRFKEKMNTTTEATSLDKLRKTYVEEVRRLEGELTFVRSQQDNVEEVRKLQQELAAVQGERDGDLVRIINQRDKAKSEVSTLREREKTLEEELIRSEQRHAEEMGQSEVKSKSTIEELQRTSFARIQKLEADLAHLQSLRDTELSLYIDERVKAESEAREFREREDRLRKQLAYSGPILLAQAVDTSSTLDSSMERSDNRLVGDADPVTGVEADDVQSESLDDTTLENYLSTTLRQSMHVATNVKQMKRHLEAHPEQTTDIGLPISHSTPAKRVSRRSLIDSQDENIFKRDKAERVQPTFISSTISSCQMCITIRLYIFVSVSLMGFLVWWLSISRKDVVEQGFRLVDP